MAGAGASGTMRRLLGAGDCGGNFEKDECDSVVYVRAFFAVIGMIGSLFIMGMIILHRTYHNFGQRLIFSLTLAAFMDTIPYFAGSNDNGQLCSFMGFLMTWFDWAVLAWVCCITHKIGVNVLYQRECKVLDVNGCLGGSAVMNALVRWLGAEVVERELAYHVICWLLTLILALVPVGWDAYGPAGPWCWIEEGRGTTTALRFGLWYIPLFVLIFLLFVANGYIYTRVHRDTRNFQGTYSPEREAEKKFLMTKVAPLKLYPVVFLALQIPPLINRIHNAAKPGDDEFALFILHVACSCMFGACIAAVYAVNTEKETWHQCTRTGIARALRMRKGGRKSASGEFPVTVLGHADDAEIDGHDSNDEEA